MKLQVPLLITIRMFRKLTSPLHPSASFKVFETPLQKQIDKNPILLWHFFLSQKEIEFGQLSH